MKSKYSIILLFVASSLLGLLVIQKIPVRFNEVIPSNTISITYNWPNATPELVEKEVTSPLEGILKTINGIKKVRSTSDYHRGSITLEITNPAESNKIRIETASQIRYVYKKLPAGVSYPVVSLNNPTDNTIRPLLNFQVIGPIVDHKLVEYIQQTIVPKLTNIKGVQKVEFQDIQPKNWHITYQPQTLTQLGITELDILNALKEVSSQENIGSLMDSKGTKHTIRTLSSLVSKEDLNNLAVRGKNGRNIQLSSIATIENVQLENNHFTRINGQPSLSVTVITNQEENPLTIAKNLKSELAALTKSLPTGYNILVEYDATEAIQEQLNQLYLQALLVFLLLLFLISLVFRNFKTVVLFLTSLLISLLLSGLLLFVMQQSIYLPHFNTYLTSLGFTAAILVLSFIDNNRNTSLYWIYGTIITSISLASISFFQNDQPQPAFMDFTLITSCCFVASIVVATQLVPALKVQFKVVVPTIIEKVNYPQLTQSYYHFLRFQNRFRTVFILISILLFGLPTFLLPSQLEGESKLATLYNTTIGSKWYNKNLAPYIHNGLGGSLRLFKEFVYVQDFHVPMQQTILQVNANLPSQATIQQMNDILLPFETELKQYPQIDRYVTTIHNNNYGNISVYFKKPYDIGQFPQSLKTKIELLTTPTSGVDWLVTGTGIPFAKRDSNHGFSNYTITVKGYHYPTLDKLVVELENRLKTKKRVENIDVHQSPDSFFKTDLLAYKMNYSKQYWNFKNVSGAQLYTTLKNYDQQKAVDFYTTINNKYAGISILPELRHSNLYSLATEPLAMTDGRSLTLTTNDYFEKVNLTPKVIREDQNYIRQINFDYSGDSRFGDDFLNQVLHEFNQSAPVGYRANQKHHDFSFQLTKKSYYLIGLALLLIIIVTAVMTESLLKPFALILSVAYTWIGTFVGYYILETPFDQGGFLSFFYSIGLTSVPIIMVINSYSTLSKNNKENNLFNYATAITENSRRILTYTLVITICLIPIIVLTHNTIFWHALSLGIFASALVTPLILLFFTPLILIIQRKT